MPAAVDLTAPVVPIQGGPPYGALDFRRFLALGYKEGAGDLDDLLVTQRAGGVGMGVDVNSGEGLVLGDTIARQGLYYSVLETTLTGATQLDVAAAHATLPRVDSVYLEVKDTLYDGSGLNKGTIRIATGTATAGANATNRTGAPVIPNTALWLADIEVAAATAGISNSNIFDVRPLFRPQFESSNTFAVSGIVAVPSGETDVVPGFYVTVRPGQISQLKRVIRKHTTSGANITFKIQRNGVDVTGLTGITTSNSVQTIALNKPLTLTDGDYIQLIVTSITGTPKNLTASVVIETAV